MCNHTDAQRDAAADLVNTTFDDNLRRELVETFRRCDATRLYRDARDRGSDHEGALRVVRFARLPTEHIAEDKG